MLYTHTKPADINHFVSVTSFKGNQDVNVDLSVLSLSSSSSTSSSSLSQPKLVVHASTEDGDMQARVQIELKIQVLQLQAFVVMGTASLQVSDKVSGHFDIQVRSDSIVYVKEADRPKGSSVCQKQTTQVKSGEKYTLRGYKANGMSRSSLAAMGLSSSSTKNNICA